MKKLRKVLSIIVIALIILLTNIGNVKATLQANPNTKYTKADSQTNWIKNFREMEKAGGAMGLSETIETDLTASSESNNIDVHMMKSTEYGAIAILSASGYGNPSNDRNIISTTGNNTGVILDTDNWENVAGGLEGYIFGGINSKYFNVYNSANSAKVGDALGNSTTSNPGCAGWHSALYSVWLNSSGPWLARGAGGIFSFSATAMGSYCRGVAVCGTGL